MFSQLRGIRLALCFLLNTDLARSASIKSKRSGVAQMSLRSLSPASQHEVASKHSKPLAGFSSLRLRLCSLAHCQNAWTTLRLTLQDRRGLDNWCSSNLILDSWLWNEQGTPDARKQGALVEEIHDCGAVGYEAPAGRHAEARWDEGDNHAQVFSLLPYQHNGVRSPSWIVMARLVYSKAGKTAPQLNVGVMSSPCEREMV